jgi:hypothetical protein
VDVFYKWVAEERFKSEVTERYRERLEKNRDKLFTFLVYNGVPWNNNIGENAVKLIASRRRDMKKTMAKDRMEDYLVLLSIYKTLHLRKTSFLKFLLSGATHIER